MRPLIRSRPALGRDAGFTVIEVMVAILILAVVTSGVALAVAGGSKLETSAKTSASIAEHGQDAYEHLVGDRAWMTGCGDSCAPTVSADMLKDDDLDITYEAEIAAELYRPEATPDGSMVEDMYRLSVTLTVPEADAARLGNPKPFSVNGTITRSGETPKGNLVVELCYAVNQIDERMSIQGCTPDGTPITMGACPPAPVGVDDCTALTKVAAQDAHSNDPSGKVKVKRLVNVVPKVKNGAEIVTGKPVDGQPGTYSFESLDAASWELILDSDEIAASDATEFRKLERWRSHDNPGTGFVSVEPSRQSRGLIMFKPSATGDVTINLDRHVRYFQVGELLHKRTTPIKDKPTDTFEGDITDAVQPTFNSPDPPTRDCSEVVCRAQTTGYLKVGGSIPGAPNCKGAYRTVYTQNWINVSLWGLNLPWQKAGSMYVSTPRYLQHFWCSWYTVDLDWDYYAPSYETDDVLPGAADKINFSLRPMPHFRDMSKNDAGAFVGKQAKSESVPASPASRSFTQVTIPKISAGLHETIRTGGTLKARKVKDLTGQINPFYTWVNPQNGGVLGPNGAPITAPLTVTGEGECYWSGPGYTKKEGACNPCWPYWDGRGTMPNSCTLVMKMTWTKTVKFTYDFRGPSNIFDTSVNGPNDWPMGEVPWGCRGVLTGCRPPSQVTLPTTTHKVNGQGVTGTVNTPPNPPAQLQAFT